jgi:7-keto-8-aminopelargonate synthetase-like enzyme
VVEMEGAERIMLGSNNYLGLTADPRVQQAARDADEDDEHEERGDPEHRADEQSVHGRVHAASVATRADGIGSDARDDRRP